MLNMNEVVCQLIQEQHTVVVPALIWDIRCNFRLAVSFLSLLVDMNDDHLAVAFDCWQGCDKLGLSAWSSCVYANTTYTTDVTRVIILLCDCHYTTVKQAHPGFMIAWQ